jgi:peroxisomal 3,2-trans-enoyl-CoA isomerase
MLPSKLKKSIAITNQSLFDQFINYPNPIIVAVNGPAIGASVTTGTLCDAVIASEKATFSTPFFRLGVPPEGGSSIHFEALMGKETAERMLGKEGWAPTGKEAAEVGLINKVVPHDKLVTSAVELAEQWINEGRTKRMHRTIESTAPGGTKDLLAANKRESAELAEAFLSHKFLNNQAEFLTKKGKTGPAMVFKVLVATRPIWHMFA